MSVTGQDDAARGLPAGDLWPLLFLHAQQPVQGPGGEVGLWQGALPGRGVQGAVAYQWDSSGNKKEKTKAM